MICSQLFLYFSMLILISCATSLCSYSIGLCDNGKTYISIMYSKIISIMIVISISDDKSIVHVFWIFAISKLFCILSCLHVLYSAQWCLGIHLFIISIKNLLFYHDNGFISQLSNYLNYNSLVSGFMIIIL